jgi:hypothetical protein
MNCSILFLGFFARFGFALGVMEIVMVWVHGRTLVVLVGFANRDKSVMSPCAMNFVWHFAFLKLLSCRTSTLQNSSCKTPSF